MDNDLTKIDKLSDVEISNKSYFEQLCDANDFITGVHEKPVLLKADNENEAQAQKDPVKHFQSGKS